MLENLLLKLRAEGAAIPGVEGGGEGRGVGKK